jgi:hypothetical protein
LGKRALSDRWFILPPHVPPSVRKFVGSLIRVEAIRRPDTARAALRKLNSLQYVDWRRTSGTGLLGEWAGTWPPQKILPRRRRYRVRATELARGPHVGQICLTADWLSTGDSWRGLRTLTTYTDRGDATALGEFFRRVEAAAHASPA